MYLLLIIPIMFAIIIVTLMFDEDRALGFVSLFLVVMVILTTLGIGFEMCKETVTERLLKDKKIEWKVTNDGQPYLILKDTSLSETWKYLEK